MNTKITSKPRQNLSPINDLVFLRSKSLEDVIETKGGGKEG